MHLLNHTLATYIKELVTLAHSYAELSNRTKLNMNDAYLVMDDMALQPMDLIRFAEYLRPICMFLLFFFIFAKVLSILTN